MYTSPVLAHLLVEDRSIAHQGRSLNRMETANMNTYALRIYSATMFALALASVPATAQNKYDTGATDTEIKIGSATSCPIPVCSQNMARLGERRRHTFR